MSYLRGTVLVISAFFLQWGWSSYGTIWGLAPQLLLVLTVALAARLGPITGMCYGFVWGLSLDVMRAQLFGGDAFALMLVGYGTGTVRRQIDVVDLVSQCVVVFLMTWGFFIFYGLLGLVFSKTFLWPGWAVFIVNPFYNCLLVPFTALLWNGPRARA